jgi:hypothetical protein
VGPLCASERRFCGFSQRLQPPAWFSSSWAYFRRLTGIEGLPEFTKTG